MVISGRQNDNSRNILAETDGTGTVLRSWAYDASDHPLAFASSSHTGETFFLHQDPHGDTIYLTRSVGDWVKKYSYDPWGKLAGEESRPGYENLSWEPIKARSFIYPIYLAPPGQVETPE